MAERFQASGLSAGGVARDPRVHAGLLLLASIPLGWLAGGAGRLPSSIVGLELAFTSDRARELLERWSEAGALGAAHASVLADFLFALNYPALLAVLARLLSLEPRPASTGRLAVWAALLAGGCDWVENVGLLQMIASPLSPPPGWTAVAAGFAATKFLLLAVWLGAAGSLVVRRLRASRGPQPQLPG